MTQDLTPEAVARYDLDQPDSHMGSATMKREDGYGDWVRFTDYEALAAKLAEVTAERDEATNQLDSARHSIDVLEKRAAEVEAEKREMVMQSLADLGQAQEAYEAQLAAEAEVARLRGALTGIKRASKARMASYGDEHSYYYVTAIAALQPKETDHE
jgi:hypothetical protein